MFQRLLEINSLQNKEQKKTKKKREEMKKKLRRKIRTEMKKAMDCLMSVATVVGWRKIKSLLLCPLRGYQLEEQISRMWRI